MMQRFRSALLPILVFGVCALTTPALEAHGWPLPIQAPVFPPPPPVPAGQGTAPPPPPPPPPAETTPPVGSNGSGSATNGNTNNGQGTTPGPSVNASPGTGPGLRIRGATPGVNTGRLARTTPRRKSKAQLAAWRSELHIPWQMAILPVDERQGYEGRQLGLDEAMKLAPSDGGWLRDDAPSLVLVYDSARPEQRRALESMQQDQRFLAAAHLFNCFLLDARMMDKRDGKMQLRLFDREGAPIGAISGNRRLRGSFELLEKAYFGHRKVELSKVLKRVTWVIEQSAKARMTLKRIEHALVCPDCGKDRNDLASTAKTLGQRLRYLKKNLDVLR